MLLIKYVLHIRALYAKVKAPNWYAVQGSDTIRRGGLL
jgi:hypothetical protein